MRIDWKIKAIAALLVLAGGAFGGYRYYTAQQETKQMAAVETVRAEHRDMKSTVSATGTYTPGMPVNFSATCVGCERNLCILRAL